MVKYVRKDDCTEGPVVERKFLPINYKSRRRTWEDFRGYEPFNIMIAVART